MKKPIFIIEHLEQELWPWCLIEYKNISKTIGKENLWFTNIKKGDVKKLVKYGVVHTLSVKSMKIEKLCILDPEAPQTLTPIDKLKFDYFLFGGILGDHPPRKRTKVELTPFVEGETRNIGKDQFSTDNAVAVVNEILNDKMLKELDFQEELEIKIDKIESTILPYKYLIKNKKPFISKELIRFIKKQDR